MKIIGLVIEGNMLNSLRVSATPFDKSQIYLHQLLAAFDYYQDKIEVLSLDCFDTLIWRNVDIPQDVFYTLQHKPVFQSLGLTPLQRMVMEDKARGHAYFKNQTSEVGLDTIYRYIHQTIDDEILNAVMQEELQTEITHTYALPALVELIRLAKAKNKKVIIVSDTYYSQQQLAYLLAKKLPLDVFNAIDKIYCSCEFQKSKSQGLFSSVIADLQVKPQAILHIGDNPIADKVAAESKHIHALQLLQGDSNLEQQFNMRSWAASFIDQSVRYHQPLYSPFKGLIANLDFEKETAEKLLGYASVGPILYAFGYFLKQEIEALQAQGKQVKVLFLMRDAYLSAQVCEILMQNKIGELVRISRFVTYAASFTDKNAIENYLAEVVHSKQFPDICRQLLLTKEISDDLVQAAEKSDQPVLTFIKLVMQEKIIQSILIASHAYRKRLFIYLRKTMDIQAGDTLVFVDLGYTATTQKKLSPILQAEFDVEIIGRYLISLPTPHLFASKKGLLDISTYDERLLTMLVRYIAIFEQICTSHERSVVDYDENGHAIFSETSVSHVQHIKIQSIQSQCLAFVREADAFLQATSMSFDITTLSHSAATELCRLMYLPTALEINFLKSLQFDFNLGTSTLLDVFDIDKGMMELRRQGLFFMEKNPKKIRTNYPAELRTAGLDLAVLLMSMERFKGKITANDLSLRREKLSIILASSTHTVKDSILALPTFDGYYSALVPLGKGNFQVGIQFGERYRWVEIESIHLVPTHAIYSPTSSEFTQEVGRFMVSDAMIKQGENLYECTSPAAFMAFLPPPDFVIKDHVLRIIFRPI